MIQHQQLAITSRLVEALHVEALLLADEARAYFDDVGRADRDRLPPLEKVLFSCESLKVTTRLMHVVAWLLTRRADAGSGSRRVPRPLGAPVDSEAEAIAGLPPAAQQLIEASRDLHARVGRLESGGAAAPMAASPAHMLWRRLESAL